MRRGSGNGTIPGSSAEPRRVNIGSSRTRADGPFPTIFPEELLPYIAATLAQVRRVVPNAVKGARVPRFTGMVTVPFGGGTLRREALSFTLWLTQRALDLVNAMSPADAERARAWLADCGGTQLLELDIPRLEISGLTVKFA
jgi:hypothetical protein